MEQKQQTFEQLLASDDLVDLARDLPEKPPTKAVTPAENKRKVVAKLNGTVDVPIEQVAVWICAPQQIEQIDPADLEREMEIFVMAGQRVPVIGRETAHGVEILTHTYMVEVIRVHNERHPEHRALLRVDIRDVDSHGAYRLVAQQLDGGPAITSYDRGIFFQKAAEVFGSEADVAKECAIHKGTVSRNLDVIRAVNIAGHKIAVHRDMPQRAATWLMSIVGRAGDLTNAPNPEAAKRVMDVIAASDIVPAKVLIKAMRAALKADTPKRGQSQLEHEGHAIGTIRRTKEGGPIRIDLTDAGDLELDVLIKVIRRAIATARMTGTN